MTELHYSLNGRRVIAADVRLPPSGVWTADLDLDEAAAPLTGAAVVQLGALTLRGTVDPTHSGEFADARRVRVLGGAGGWGKELPPRSYHNDAGVKRSTILQDAAREAGETSCSPTAWRPASGPITSGRRALRRRCSSTSRPPRCGGWIPRA